MDGHASDLRTGLPWQTVEIHEPVRLLVVIDAPPERILTAIARVPAVQRLVSNQWIQLAAWHPPGAGLSQFAGDRFVPYVPESHRLPVVPRSIDWFGGQRGHLPPVRTAAALVGGQP
jgi:hypothetical protein